MAFIFLKCFQNFRTLFYMQNKNIAKIFFLFSVLLAGGFSYAQTDKKPVTADKKAVLESLAAAQQKQMQSRSSYLKNFLFLREIYPS